VRAGGGFVRSEAPLVRWASEQAAFPPRIALDELWFTRLHDEGHLRVAERRWEPQTGRAAAAAHRSTAAPRCVPANRSAPTYSPIHRSPPHQTRPPRASSATRRGRAAGCAAAAAATLRGWTRRSTPFRCLLKRWCSASACAAAREQGLGTWVGAGGGGSRRWCIDAADELGGSTLWRWL
jgi:hypothetical protein